MHQLLTQHQLKWFIVGCEFGGTGFTASYLSKCGLPCGHEALLWDGQHFRIRDPIQQIENLQAECNHSYSTFYRVEHELTRLPVVLVTRYPLATLSSHVSYHLQHGSTFSVDMLIMHILVKYEAFERSGRIEARFRLERDLPALAQFFGLRPRSASGVYRNPHNKGGVRLRWQDIHSCKLRQQLYDLTLIYGYKP